MDLTKDNWSSPVTAEEGAEILAPSVKATASSANHLAIKPKTNLTTAILVATLCAAFFVMMGSRFWSRWFQSKLARRCFPDLYKLQLPWWCWLGWMLWLLATNRTVVSIATVMIVSGVIYRRQRHVKRCKVAACKVAAVQVSDKAYRYLQEAHGEVLVSRLRCIIANDLHPLDEEQQLFIARQVWPLVVEKIEMDERIEKNRRGWSPPFQDYWIWNLNM
jgi:hypothetical protein